MSPDSDSVPPEEALPLTRREFLLGSAGGVALMTLGGGTFVTGNGQVSQDPWTHDRLNPVATPPTNVTRHWLAPSLWGNRLQDWRLNGGRIECLRGEAGFEVRTVGLLTRQIVSRNAPGHIAPSPDSLTTPDRAASVAS